MNIETTIAIAKALNMLLKEGMLVDFRSGRDGRIQPFIPAQPIPGIPNWQEWCSKLQKCGVKFEHDSGVIISNWGGTKCDFTCGWHRHRIPEQPVPATIVNYLNEEKTMSENTNKPKSIKLQLPEIVVSEDVGGVRIYLYDENGMSHNLAGLAVMDFKVGNGSLLGVGRGSTHYIHGDYYTKQAFKRATQSPKELTVQEVEKLLGYKIKIVSKTE